MAKVAFDIKYEVNGTDKFKGIMKENVRDVDHMMKMLDKMGRTRVGRKTYGGFKVTPDMKEAAKMASGRLKDYKSKAPEGEMVGYTDRITIGLKNISGMIEESEAVVKRRMASLTGKGLTQTTYFKKLQEQLQELQSKAINNVRASMAGLKTPDSSMLQARVRVQIKDIYEKLEADLKALYQKGNLTMASARGLVDTAKTDTKLAIGGGKEAGKTKESLSQAKQKLNELARDIFRSLESMHKEFRGKGQLTAKASEVRQALVDSLLKIKQEFKKLEGQRTIDPKDVDLLGDKVKALKSLAKRKLSATLTANRKAVKDEIKAIKETARDRSKTAKEQARKLMRAGRESTKMAQAKANMVHKVANLMHQNMSHLKKEARSAGKLKSISLKVLIKDLRNTFKMARGKINSTTKGSLEELNVELNKIFSGVKQNVESLKQKQQKSKTNALGNLLNAHTLRGAGGVAGMAIQQAGSMIEQGVSASHTKGRVASSMRDMMTAGLYASKRMILMEVSNIFAQVADLVVELGLEIPRILLSVLAGGLKAVGAMLMKGLATAVIMNVQALRAAFGTVLVGISGAVVTAGIGIVFALLSIVKEIQNLITNLLSSILEIVQSVIKVIIQTVVVLIKSAFKIIGALFKVFMTSLKNVFKGFVEFIKRGIEVLTKLISNSLKEYITMTEYATRAFKETVGVAGQSLTKFQTLISGLRGNFGFEVEDVGEAVFDIVSSGFRDVAKAKEISANASMLAISAESDLKTSTNAMITALQNFDTQGENTESIMRTLASATTLGRMTMGELGNSMKSVMGLASRAGMSFKETMLSLSMMTRVFGRGSIEEGTRFFNRFIESIAMPSSKARKELEMLGISMQGIGQKGRAVEDIFTLVDKMKNLELRDVRKVFTTIQSRRAWLALTKDVEQFKSMLGDFGVVAQNVEWQFKQMLETPQRAIKMLQQSFKVLLSNIGMTVWKSLAGVIQKVGKAVQQMVKWLTSPHGGVKFFEEMIKWAQPIMNVLFKPLNTAFTKLMEFLIRGRGYGNEFFKIFQTDFAKTLQQGIINIIKNFYRLVEYVSIVISKLEIVKTTFDLITSTIKKIFDMLSGADSNEFVANIINGVNSIKGIIYAMMGDFSLMSQNSLKAIMFTIDNMIGVIFDTIMNTLRSVATALYNLFTPVIDAIMLFIGNRLKATLMSTMSSVINKFSEALASGEYGPFGGVMNQITNGLDDLARNLNMSTSKGVRFATKTNVEQERKNAEARKKAGESHKQDFKDMVTPNKFDLLGLLTGGVTGVVQQKVTKNLVDMLFTGVGESVRPSGSAGVKVATSGFIDSGVSNTKDRNAIMQKLIAMYGDKIYTALNNIDKETKIVTGTGETVTTGSRVKEITELMQSVGRGTATEESYLKLDQILAEIVNLGDTTLNRKRGIDIAESAGEDAGDMQELIGIVKMFIGKYQQQKATGKSVDNLVKGNVMKTITTFIKDSKTNLGSGTDRMKGLFDTLAKQLSEGLKVKVTAKDVQMAIGVKTATGPVGAIAREKEVNKLKKQQKIKEDEVMRAEDARRDDFQSTTFKNIIHETMKEFVDQGKIAWGDIEKYSRYVLEQFTMDPDSDTSGAPATLISEAVGKVFEKYQSDLHNKEISRKQSDLDIINKKLDKARGGRDDTTIEKEAQAERKAQYTAKIQEMSDEQLVEERKKQNKRQNRFAESKFSDDGESVYSMDASKRMQQQKDAFEEAYKNGRKALENEEGPGKRFETREEFGKRTRTKGGDISQHDIDMQEKIDKAKAKKRGDARLRGEIVEKEMKFRRGREQDKKEYEEKMRTAPESKKAGITREYQLKRSRADAERFGGAKSILDERIKKLESSPEGRTAKGRQKLKELKEKSGKLGARKQKSDEEIKRLEGEEKDAKKKEEIAKNANKANQSIIEQKKILENTSKAILEQNNISKTANGLLSMIVSTMRNKDGALTKGGTQEYRRMANNWMGNKVSEVS